MAKKAAGRNVRKSRSQRSNLETPVTSQSSSSRYYSAESNGAERDYREILKEFVSSPAVKYVAGGIATALLTRLANNMADRYPEISNFIRENMDTLESRLGEFRGNLDGDTTSRH